MLRQTLGSQNVRESVCWSLPKAFCFIRRLYSSPSFNRQPPAKGVYNVLEAGVYRGLAKYARLRMVRNQENVTAQVVPQKAACGRARDRKANFSSANSPTDRLSEGVPGHHRGVPGQL